MITLPERKVETGANTIRETLVSIGQPATMMKGVDGLFNGTPPAPTLPPGSYKCEIPLVPPSVNHYKQPNGRGGYYVTKEAQAFIDAVYLVTRHAPVYPIAGEFYEIRLTVYVSRKKFLRGDSDNMEKVAFDALTNAHLIKDDRYITRHTHNRFPVETADQERTEYVIIGRKEP